KSAGTACRALRPFSMAVTRAQLAYSRRGDERCSTSTRYCGIYWRGRANPGRKAMNPKPKPGGPVAGAAASLHHRSPMAESALVIAAHPDDGDFGAAGYSAQLAARGWDVYF